MGKPKLSKTREKSVYSYVDAKTNKKMYAYRYRYTRTDGKKADVYKQNFKTLKEAALALTKVKAELLSGNYNKVDYADLTVNQLYDMYFKHLDHKSDKLKPTTIHNIKTAMNRIVPLIGDMRVRDLTTYAYNEKVISVLKEKNKASTIENYHAKFCIVLNFAVENEIIERNRLAGIKIKVENANGNDIYSKDELHKILSYTKIERPHMYEILVFLANTGTRVGEALGLKWSDVDLENRIISINCTRDRFGERPPKSSNSFRDIPVPTQLYNVLKKYKAEQKAGLLKKGVPVNNEKFEKRYVFLKRDGAPVKYHSVPQLLEKISNVYGFYCKAHKFRHTYASVLISEGVDVATVAKLLGDTVSTVQKVYVHAVDSKRDEAILKFEKAMGNL